MYIVVKSLCRTPETNIIVYMSPILQKNVTVTKQKEIKMEKYKKKQSFKNVSSQICAPHGK